MYDCIIVGAGPAGGTAAYHLAKRGRSVLILEKETLPRYKPCSGGVSPAIGQWFEFDFEPAISLKVDQIRYSWQMSDAVEVSLRAEPMWMVQRDKFDHFLIEQAQQQGAELQDNAEVTGIKFSHDRWQVSTSKEPVVELAAFVIAADGAKGPMAKWLGLFGGKRRMSAVLEVKAQNPPDSPEMHFEFGGKKIKNGFIWNFPHTGGNSISVATFIDGEPKDLQSVLTEYAQTVGIDISNSQRYEHPLLLWDGDRQLHTQNAVVAGEAARIADPLMGEGIRPSIFSGMKAAEAIDLALAGDGNALEKYTQVMSAEWGADLKMAGRIAGAFYRFPGVGYKIIKQPVATQVMSKILCGQLSYAEVASTAIKRLSGSLIPGKKSRS
ncbi:MAG: geranylgeranyl reductase family protein [Hormoscilla sp. GM102CHS1]|nr:geranylgeranyl reductase family protein [Hormoscilla sp. GM102CHS1]